MKSIGVLAAGLVLLMLAAVSAGPKPDRQAMGLFQPLYQGQKVVLKDVGAAYEIRVIPDLDAGHEVVEVGPDFIVLEDAAGTETRIPIYAIKAITRIKNPR